MEFSDKDIRRARQIVQVLNSKAFNDKAIASSKFGRHSIITGDTQFQARERGFVLVGGGAAPRGSFDEGRAIAQLFRTYRRNSAIESSFIGPPEPLTKGTKSGVGTNLPAVYDPRLSAFQRARQARFRSEAEARNRSFDPIFKYRINSSVGLFHSKSKSAMDSASVFQSAGVSNLERAYESSISDLHTVPTEEEMLTKDERYERHRLAKQELNRSRRSGLRAYVYDQMGDYERTRYDLSQKYKSSSLADAKIRSDALKKLPNWMKNLVDNSKLSTKFLFNMSNGIDHAKKIPFLGNMLSDPVTAGVALGMGSIALTNATSKRADEANKNIVSQMNARNVYGPVSQTFLKTAHLAGIQDPTKIQELWGKLTTKYGDADAFLSSVGSHTAEMKGGKEKTFLAQALGFDPTLMAMADMYGGGFWNIGAMSERQSLGDLARTKMKQDQMTRTGSGLFDTIVGTFSNASVASRFVDDDKFYDDIIFKKFKTDSAVNSQDSYQREYSTGASNSPSGGKVINVSINTGDVVLPNAKDGQSFADDLFDFSEKKTGTLHAFDSGIK